MVQLPSLGGAGFSVSPGVEPPKVWIGGREKPVMSNAAIAIPSDSVKIFSQIQFLPSGSR